MSDWSSQVDKMKRLEDIKYLKTDHLRMSSTN